MAKLTVEDSSLTAVADAIRTKGETTDALVFPEGFVGAIENIKIGDDPDSNFRLLVNKRITEVTADMLKGVTSIGAYAFYTCSILTKVELPESIRTISSAAFNNCSGLSSINLPSGITAINSNTFGRTGLVSITVPPNVKEIGSSSFANSTRLTTVEMKPITPPTLSASAFNGCTALSTIIVPKGTLSDYQTATNWSAFADIMVEATE